MLPPRGVLGIKPCFHPGAYSGLNHASTQGRTRDFGLGANIEEERTRFLGLVNHSSNFIKPGSICSYHLMLFLLFTFSVRG